MSKPDLGDLNLGSRGRLGFSGTAFGRSKFAALVAKAAAARVK